MAVDHCMRPSDDDRERVVGALCEQTAHGRLTTDEFIERADTAYAAWSGDDLRRLTADLPVEIVFAGALAAADR